MQKRLPGVYPQQKKDKSISYRSSLTYRRRHISLGSYDSMVKAHAAYLEAGTIVKDPNLTLRDYSPHRILPMEKWVILINFRDNHFYFATPIYIKKKYFEYYLSPSMILKFDIDDLFYYSTRTIMKRGGHFFVADYGMQVNILNRYGIKNYAVLNRDYRFVNNDIYDYRYENIEIINRYNGVCQFTKNGKTFYRVKIHIVGNYTVGTYSTETEAAIAYNKAIDIVKKAGVTKQFVPNYLEGLSPIVYADIYSGVAISPKIKNYGSGASIV